MMNHHRTRDLEAQIETLTKRVVELDELNVNLKRWQDIARPQLEARVAELRNWLAWAAGEQSGRAPDSVGDADLCQMVKAAVGVDRTRVAELTTRLYGEGVSKRDRIEVLEARVVELHGEAMQTSALLRISRNACNAATFNNGALRTRNRQLEDEVAAMMKRTEEYGRKARDAEKSHE